MPRDRNVPELQVLIDALRPFAKLCPWLEQEATEGDDGEIWGTQDFEMVLKGEGSMSRDYVTAGMIRRARAALLAFALDMKDGDGPPD
jgi:hypothetical protein